jgi:hypothetical protein
MDTMIAPRAVRIGTPSRNDRSISPGLERGVHLVPFSCAVDENRLCVCLGIWVTGVPFEIFLRESVEGECGDRAFKKRGRHSPRTTGAAPATEIVAVDTHEALIHVRLPFLEL